MARENQGLQVALILLVMTTVLLMVTTYVFYRKAEEKQGAATAALSAKQQAERERDTSLFKVQALMFMIGKGEISETQLQAQLASDEEMSKLMAEFNADMDMYGEGLPPEERNYSTLPRNIIAAIQAKNVTVTDRTQQNTTIGLELKTVKDDEAKRTQIAVTGQEGAGKELATERANFTSKITEVQGKMDESFAKLTKLGEQMNDVRQKAAEQVATADKQIKSQEDQILTLIAQREDAKPKPPSNPDGLISTVDTASEMCSINLGVADGLRVKTSFSVYDAQETSLRTASQKARIEVVNLVGEHTAEARIVSQTDITNPILPGDLIFSPVWRAGRRLRFALAGFMDLEPKDNRSDRNYIRNLITINGGIIDAELHDDGRPQGRISSETRYLVLGEGPDENTPKAFRDEFGRLTDDATRKSVERISVNELLDLMGWKPEVRRVTLGSGASTGADQSDFRQRRAPGAPGAGSSAYPK